MMSRNRGSKSMYIDDRDRNADFDWLHMPAADLVSERILEDEDESEWQAAFDRLRERFPDASAERIMEALRENDGHAGYAAKVLREQSDGQIKAVDPDDAEMVATILSSPAMFKHSCKETFRKYDKNGGGHLDWNEVVCLTGILYSKFGLERPPDSVLRAFFEATDANGDGLLSERDFRKFFESFLRHSFFDERKFKMILSGQESPANSKNRKVNGAERAVLYPSNIVEPR